MAMKSMRSCFSIWAKIALKTFLVAVAIGYGTEGLSAQEVDRATWHDKFRQLEEILPTPNDYRTASGAPGHAYWQQNVDYVIDVELDEEQRAITGHEKVTYTNRSPDPLTYIWLQLDANIHAPDSDSKLTQTAGGRDTVSLEQLRRQIALGKFDGSMKIRSVRDSADGSELKFTIVKTMMRIDLPKPVPTGASYTFEVDWFYKINNSKLAGGRSGYEEFESDGNCIFEMAQWYPRACAYTDVNGWQHKQFLGSGEFTLEFGNYTVNITVPADHVVASTGELQNPDIVLTQAWRENLERARTSGVPVFVATPDEALEREKQKSKEKKTWSFQAEMVRDFAFASSRKFIWDAMGCKLGDRTVMAMSYFPNEGEPLWSRYSTHAVAHTLEVYSRMTFDYPYPVAISVNGPVGGMEYPMICFNGPRPEKDGTYSPRSKYGLISVVIHEVGHNWFPMIVNSDERQWTWMDEGLNTFMQYLAEQEWEEKYPSRRGEPAEIAEYMADPNQMPIMTSSDSLVQFGNNGYAKPATALNVLRETVLGRELFDFSFKQYANRWMFKRPMPADFFRTMEDASGVDLDWFWRGWFYSTDQVDISVENVRKMRLDTGASYIEKPQEQARDALKPETLSEQRNRDLAKRTERFPELIDFYNEYNPLRVTDEDREQYEKMLKGLDETQLELFSQLPTVYVVEFANQGGLVAPINVKLEFEDGTFETHRIPVEIWRSNNSKVARMFLTAKAVRRVILDPMLESADTDAENNVYPRQISDQPAKLETGPMRGRDGERMGERGANPMQKAKQEEEKRAKAASSGEEGSGSEQKSESGESGGEGL